MADSHSHRIEVRVPSRDFAEGVQTALERLGYELVPVRALAPAPAVRIVAGDRLRRLGAELTQPVILVGSHQDRVDTRVVGSVKRPARLHELYPLLQRALEEHPRAVPRIATALPARALRGGAESPCAVVSLSERGCCLRTGETLRRDETLRLQFLLPSGAVVNTWAQPRYQSDNRAGMVFDRLPENSRSAIFEYVTRSLTANP